MRDMPTLGFVDPDSAHRRMAKTAAEIELVAWLRAQARDRTPDGKRGGPCWYLVTVRPGTEVAMAMPATVDFSFRLNIQSLLRVKTPVPHQRRARRSVPRRMWHLQGNFRKQ